LHSCEATITTTDELAILPFYLTTGLDLRAVRIFRFLRIFRILIMARYENTMTLFRVAFKLIKEELVLFFVVTVMTLYISGMGIFYFEKRAQPEVFESMFDGLWWAVVTLTTVGYGDSYPVTVGGKIFTFVILFIGLAIVAVPTGLFATALSKARELSEENSGD
jgi:voltage-gated potassium channel